MHALLDFLFPPRVDERIVRAGAPESLLPHLAPVLVDYTHPPTVALLPFTNIHVRAALHEAKYHGSPAAFAQLSATIAEYLLDSDEGSGKSIIVPVPLGAARRKERGFNQVEEVARAALKSFGSDFVLDTKLLKRVIETPSQVSLGGDERRKNMRGAFIATRPCDPGVRYIVVDDVITTGATLGAALDALAATGATHLLPLALAH